MGRGTVLTREQLYERVWSKAADHVAEDLGISGSALARICRQLEVPTPPRGYWARVAAGQAPERSALPKPQPRTPLRYEFFPSMLSSQHHAQLRKAKAALDAAPVGAVSPVADALSRPHRLIKRYRDAVIGASKDGHLPWAAPCLDVVASESSLDRALRVMDAVLKSMEQLGWSVEVAVATRSTSSMPSVSTSVLVDGVKIGFGVREKFDTVEVKPKPGVRPSLHSIITGKPDRVTERRPTGTLRLEVKVPVRLPRRTWGDTKTQRVEDLIEEFLKGILLAAAALKEDQERRRQQAEERERAERARREDAELAAKERGRVESLKRRLELWEDARSVRSFVAFVEERAAPGGPPPEWHRWAKEYADRLDQASLQGLLPQPSERPLT